MLHKRLIKSILTRLLMILVFHFRVDTRFSRNSLIMKIIIKIRIFELTRLFIFVIFVFILFIFVFIVSFVFIFIIFAFITFIYEDENAKKEFIYFFKLIC